MVSGMEQKKVPHDPLTIALPVEVRLPRVLVQRANISGRIFGSPRIVAVEEGVPVAQYRDLGPVNAPQALLKFHESPQ